MRAPDNRPDAKTKHRWHLAPLLLVGLSAACGDPTHPNRAPEAGSTIPDQTVAVGDSVWMDVSYYFGDPDGDELTYSAATSAAAVAAAAISGSTVTISGVAKGAANLTVTARDPGGLSAQAPFTVTVVADPEREALVALYEAADGPNWIENANWLTEEPLGEWYGVLVDDVGRVKALSLSDNRLTGTVPPELGNLARLAYLSLHNNELTGTIPPELGNLASLATLYLSANELTGAVPPELGNLASLATMTLKYNELTGAVPDSFLRLDRLWGLWIEENNGLCVPRTSVFDEWVDGLVVFSGSSCDS